jgi:hypothetical protein
VLDHKDALLLISRYNGDIAKSAIVFARAHNITTTTSRKLLLAALQGEQHAIT